MVATLGLSQPLGQYVLEYAILVLTLSITGDIKNGSSPQASFFNHLSAPNILPDPFHIFRHRVRVVTVTARVPVLPFVFGEAIYILIRSTSNII